MNHLHPDDRAAAIEACSRATSMGRDHEFEYRMIHSDGHAVWFRDSLFVDIQDGKPVRLRGILIDISEQMQMQYAIKESEQLLRLIASSAKDAIFRRRIHPALQYEYISPAVFDITGYSAEVLRGRISVQKSFIRMTGGSWEPALSSSHRATR